LGYAATVEKLLTPTRSVPAEHIMIFSNKTYFWLFALCGWLFLSLFLPLHPQTQKKITAVRFAGNSYYSTRELTDGLSVRSGAVLSDDFFDRSAKTLKEMYRISGFYAFHIDSTAVTYSDDSTAVHVHFFITEGAQTTVQKIQFIGNNVVSSSTLLFLMETSVGEPLNERLLESDIQSILNYYSNIGRPFAKIRSDSISVGEDDPTQLQLTLVVDEGPRVFLNELIVEGNTSTNTDVIVREARMEQRKLFQQETLEKIKRRLDRTQLFSSVSEPQLYITKAAAPDSLIGGVSITVKEGNANTFDGILGYVPSNIPNAKGYFTGDLFVAFRNLFGTGRKAVVKWKRENELTQELELQYREPWIFGLPIGMSGSFFQRKQDSSYVKSRFELRGDFAFSEELSVAANVTSESIYPAADLQQFSVFESKVLSFGGEILYDTRDNFRNPTAGIRYATSVQQGVKEITGPQKYLYLTAERKYAVQKFSVDAEGYLSTFPRQVVMLGVHGKQITSSRLEVSDLYQFGGTTTLRGYRENQFFAAKIAWVNLEYRFLTGRASSLYGFADAGYFFRPDDPLTKMSQQEKSLYGYGLGTRLETGLGILNMTFALGEGDSFSEGKIHVGIVNEF
jgi:outer membrane protein insertion porin family